MSCPLQAPLWAAVEGPPAAAICCPLHVLHCYLQQQRLPYPFCYPPHPAACAEQGRGRLAGGAASTRCGEGLAPMRAAAGGERAEALQACLSAADYWAAAAERGLLKAEGCRERAAGLQVCPLVVDEALAAAAAVAVAGIAGGASGAVTARLWQIKHACDSIACCCEHAAAAAAAGFDGARLASLPLPFPLLYLLLSDPTPERLVVGLAQPQRLQLSPNSHRPWGGSPAAAGAGAGARTAASHLR
mmetsp:Transcript_31233/g.81374  ORF Transcript_31233/g.81374 Transcript_31233/m.81374 type:complete len:245 (+) Transcript_31233:174-908(+)|eukprot:72225-Pelagomonas_calceolata.AAC.2